MRDRRRTGRRQHGFTLIEVMVSLGVMTVGAMAILALQQQSIRSNAHARQLTIATEIAERWAERFKQDAQTWNMVGEASGTPTAADVLSRTKWLKQINSRPNEFQQIENLEEPVSNAFDYQGFDVPSIEKKYFYCASFRPSWVYFGRAMRIDIRVWWARENIQRMSGGVSNITDQFEDCADPPVTLDPGGEQYWNYHVVYLPTVVRMVEPQ
jgi:prepilin-type N-terminal cleavage/methylation domain-containing protein